MPLCQSGWFGEGVRKGLRDEGGKGEGGGAHRGLRGGTEAEIPRERDSQDQLETDGRYKIGLVSHFVINIKITIVSSQVRP